LFSFWKYDVFRKKCLLLLNISGVKDYEHLRYPQLSQQNAALGDVIAKYVQCSVAGIRKKFLEESQTTLVLNKEWKDYSA